MSDTGANKNADGQVAVQANAATAAAAPENAVNGAAPAAAQPPPTPFQSFLGVAKSLVIRALIVYFVMQWFKKPAPPATNSSGGPVAILHPAKNIFIDGTRLSLYVYLAESDVPDFATENLFWLKDNLVYGDWYGGATGDGSFTMEKNISITPKIRNNGSLFLHAYVTRSGESPDPSAPNYAKNAKFAYLKKQLNKFKKLKNSGTKNLLTGETEKAAVEEGKIISHWHPNITVNLVTDQTAWTFGSIPAPLDQFITFTDDKKFYKPVLWGNDFWNMLRDYKPINDTDNELTIRFTYQPLSLIKWQMYAAQGMRQMWNVFGDSEPDQSDEEQDTLKETLMDTNPYLLGITIAVSILHSVFELLAFKNDIQFWNKRDSLEGLSVRSVFFAVFQSLIVLLYVMDNETNTIVRISCLVGLGIECWKIYKVVDIKFENGWIRFKDKGSYVESDTKKYDDLAYKYLSWLCFPLLACYCVYSLFYQEHKGWYSFVLNLLYGYLLTFGFIMMTPQLFINYKLKSVAHLPWRMLTYKFLNTFIDDMFAFVIKMPTMYRLGCFRDDIVFLIFLYQKWIYPVDKTRRNEFGYAEVNADQKAVEDKENSTEVVEKENGDSPRNNKEKTKNEKDSPKNKTETKKEK